MKRHGRYFVYIVECKNGTYYTGYTNNLENRVKLHNSGRGAKYLKGKLPVKLVFAKPYRYYKNALNKEKEVKKFSRREKEALVRSFRKITRSTRPAFISKLIS